MLYHIILTYTNPGLSNYYIQSNLLQFYIFPIVKLKKKKIILTAFTTVLRAWTELYRHNLLVNCLIILHWFMLLWQLYVDFPVSEQGCGHSVKITIMQVQRILLTRICKLRHPFKTNTEMCVCDFIYIQNHLYSKVPSFSFIKYDNLYDKSHCVTIVMS